MVPAVLRQPHGDGRAVFSHELPRTLAGVHDGLSLGKVCMYANVSWKGSVSVILFAILVFTAFGWSAMMGHLPFEVCRACCSLGSWEGFRTF